MIQTKAQNNLIDAEKCVSELEGKDAKVQAIYKGLCKSFPVMVRTCGLCQAIAFSAAKAQGKDKPRAEAHTLFLKHIGGLLGEENPLDAIRRASATEYMLHTRRVLSAWIYFKRFAESILQVEEEEDIK